MLVTVLNSPKAIEMSLIVVRAFIRLRKILSTHKELAQKLKELELKVDSNDKKIQAIFKVINKLVTPPVKKKRKMGFTIEE